MRQRDVEQLSEYLDGRLSPSDSARLETRLASDPALASTLDALRESRSLLRRLPHRRAPRNFTLTRQMVGLKPPLPRAYPVFRFATALATLLFALSFLVNQVGQTANSAPMPAYGIGGGPDAAVTEAPALALAPAAQEISPTEMALSVPAASPEPSADTSRAMQEPAAKNAAEPAPAPLLTQWQIGLGLAALLGMAAMLILRLLAARKWR